MQQNTATHHKRSVPTQHKTVQPAAKKIIPADENALAGQVFGTIIGWTFGPVLLVWFLWAGLKRSRRRWRALEGYREVHVIHEYPAKNG